MTIRYVLWILVLAMVGGNIAFDLTAAPLVRRLADKAEGQRAWGNPTSAPLGHPLRAPLRRVDERVALGGIARHVFSARFALTALPLLVVLYFASKGQLRDSHLGLAMALGGFVLAVKAMLWESLWLIADVYTAF